jgi:hypothetical protein
MSVIVIDGPEKAGKTTIIEELIKRYISLDISVTRRHWGLVNPDDRVYSDTLQADINSNKLIIWDRCWPSEYVYGQLGFHTDHRGTNDPWLLEWLHGRAVQTNGLRAMILGPDAQTLASHRDKSDMPVDPRMERNLYKEYAERYGWLIYENQHSTKGLDRTVASIILKYRTITCSNPVTLPPHYCALPPHYCGPVDAKVIVVGDMRGENRIPGSWLPFTSRMTTMFGRLFDDKAFEVGWTNAHDCPPVALAGAKVIIACGNKAQLWVKNYVKGGKRVISVPHPSYLFRFNNPTTVAQRESVNQIISQLVKEM